MKTLREMKAWLDAGIVSLKSNEFMPDEEWRSIHDRMNEDLSILTEAMRMTQIPKVFVIQEGQNDYSPAEKFGEVHFVTRGDLRNMEGTQQNSQVAADIRRFLSNYVSGTDYIVPVGNPMVVALLTMALSAGDHKFLKWDGRHAAYIPFTLNIKSVRQ